MPPDFVVPECSEDVAASVLQLLKTGGAVSSGTSVILAPENVEFSSTNELPPDVGDVILTQQQSGDTTEQQVAEKSSVVTPGGAVSNVLLDPASVSADSRLILCFANAQNPPS